MKNIKQEIKLLFIWSILLFMVIITNCANKESFVLVNTERCSVTYLNNEALISCPDGTEVILPATVIAETIVNVDNIIVKVPKHKCDKE